MATARRARSKITTASPSIPNVHSLPYRENMNAAQQRLRGTQLDVNAQRRIGENASQILPTAEPVMSPRRLTPLEQILADQREILRRLDALGSSSMETKRELRDLRQLIVDEFGVGQGDVEPETAAEPEAESAEPADTNSDELTPEPAA